MDFNYVDVAVEGSEIVCWARNKSGELEVYTDLVSDNCYAFIPDNTGEKSKFRDLFGNPMKQLFFNSTYDMRKYAKRADNVYESDVDIRYKFIIENFMDADLEAPCNVGYYDIEVDFNLDEGTGYPSIYNPFGAINSVSLFDKNEEKYWMLMLHESDRKFDFEETDYPVEQLFFGNERDLLLAFVDVIDDIDILTAWNGKAFDLPYIMERLIKLFGLKRAKSMLCRNGLEAVKREYVNDYKEETWTWELKGRTHLDMMELFIKFIPKSLDSNSLDNVCKQVLGKEKIGYKGDLGELYRTNPEKFFVYSLHDSRLLMLLDKKLDLLTIAITSARLNCVLFEDVLGSIKPIETAFIKFCRKKDNIVLPDKVHHDKEDFKGAIVYDTLSGLHGWTFSIDLTALYPSMMMMLGMSPETLIGQCVEEEYDYYKVITGSCEMVRVNIEDTDEVIETTGQELLEQIREEGFTISASGTIYSGEMGILAEFVKEGFDRRKHYKKLMFEAGEAGDEANRTKYNLLQKVIKIGNNSIYGCVSNQYFRLFDIRMARSITYTGRIVSKQQARATNDILNREIENATV